MRVRFRDFQKLYHHDHNKCQKPGKDLFYDQSEGGHVEYFYGASFSR